jgi:hypothetical protein
MRNPGSRLDLVEQLADTVDFSFRKETLWPLHEIAEGRIIEPGGIHEAAADEFIDDFVDVADLIGGVRAIGQKCREDFFGSIAVEADEGADEQAKAVALLSRCGSRP